MSEADAPVAPLDRRTRVRAALAGSVGNLIEWYDFYVYAYTALYFASHFFPSGDRTAQLLNVAAIYAAGFLIRPLGGWYFGRLADTRGRRTAMIVSVLLMGFGGLVIAVLPGFATIGAAAPALLLVARLMQGFSSGGQYGAAATYLSEIAEPRRRGLLASLQFVTLIAGQLTALFVIWLLAAGLGEDAMRSWGWRLPFVIGALLAVGLLLFREMMHETSPSTRKPGAGTLRLLLRYPGSLFTVMALSAGGGLCLYTFTTYLQKYLVNTAGLDMQSAARAMMVATIGFLVLQPAIGALSDRIGRRTCLLIFSGGMALSAQPLLVALGGATSPYEAAALAFLALSILSFYTSVSGLFKAELFPAEIRALGVGLAHAIATAIFGGTAEFVALYLKQIGHEAWFGWYVAAICCLSFVAALRMREPSRRGYLANG